MIRYVDISFNEYKKVYRQGEKFELIIEVPLKKEYPSITNKNANRQPPMTF